MGNAPSASVHADAEELEPLLVARCYLYLLFHKVLGGEPNVALLRAVTSETTGAALGAFSRAEDTLGSFAAFAAGIEDGFEQDVLSEYNRMFVGIGKPQIYPWEAPHVTHRPTLLQESTLRIRRMYEAYGLKAKLKGSVSDDHISLMCCFMGQLSDKVLSAFREGNFRTMESILADQHHFATTHMLNWLPGLVDQATSIEHPALYPQVIEALTAFVGVDAGFAAEAAVWAGELVGWDWKPNPERISGSVEESIPLLGAIQLRGLEENELDYL